MEIQIFWPRFLTAVHYYACQNIRRDIFKSPVARTPKILKKRIFTEQTLTIFLCADDVHLGLPREMQSRKSHQKVQKTTGECQTSCLCLLVVIERHLSITQTNASGVKERRRHRSTPARRHGPSKRAQASGHRGETHGVVHLALAAESEPEPPCWRCEAGASRRAESSRGRARTDRIPGRSPPPLTVSTPNACADRLGDA